MSDIQIIIERVQKGDSNAIKDFLATYATRIYNFPRNRFCEQLVERGEFYSYVAAQLADGKRLLKYDPEKGQFDVWFTTVLNNFLKTIITYKLKKETELGIHYITQEQVEEIQTVEPTPAEILEFEQDKVNITQIFHQINETEKCVVILLLLFYKDLEPEDLQYLSNYTGKSPTDIALGLEQLLSTDLLEKSQRIIQESKKIAGLSLSLQKLRSSIEKLKYLLQIEFESNPTNVERIQQFQGDLSKLELTECKKKTKYHQLCQVQRHGKSLVLLKNKRIAEFLGIKIGTVTSTISRLRMKFQRSL